MQTVVVVKEEVKDQIIVEVQQKVEFDLDNPELNLIESNKFLLEHGLKEYIKQINP